MAGGIAETTPFLRERIKKHLTIVVVYPKLSSALQQSVANRDRKKLLGFSTD
jgi:hypothetical protein